MPLASAAPTALYTLAALTGLLALAPPPVLPAQAPLALMRAPGPQDRVLVVAPHPDDESLCCAGMLLRAHANGAATAVVWITAGDGFSLDAMAVEHSLWPTQADLRRLGAQRLVEAAAAASELGVPRSNQYFLGYPDHGITALMADYYQRGYLSKYTGLSAVSYPQALSPYASFTGSNLERDLARVIDQFAPTLVLAAAPEDRHPDHSASGALTRRLLEQRGQLDHLRYWIVHAPRWPQPRRYQPQLSLAPPALATALQWSSLPLIADERARKLAALRDHHSQIQLMQGFMLSFVRANELFAAPSRSEQAPVGH
jgi:LmbE family N-acetylglucosaminyl deacetylase